MPPGKPIFSPSLFIGISMSITAFPVLARIIQERNMSKTPIGVLAIASAANDDVTAWCLLAIVIAVAKAGSFLSAIYTVGLTLLFIALMFGMIRPFLRKIGERYANEEVINKTFVGSIFLVLILSSVTTEIIGIHALFGAFMAGVVMPTNTGFREVMMEKVEDIALVFFLAIHIFVFHKRINTPEVWGVCIFLIFIAILGKLGGCTIAARLVGESWKDSLTVGTLMNTRGLMELVALNIGYEMGVLPPEIFVILILMALVTTFMTTPLLKAVERLFQTSESRPSNKFKLLFIFGRPESGKELLAFIAHLFGQRVEEMELIAAHCTIGSDVNPQKAKEYAQTSFTPLEQEAARLKLHVEQRYKVTDHLSREIHQLANKEKINLLFIGSGNRSAQLVQKPFHCPVAIFVNRGIHYIRHPFLLLLDENDLSLLPLVQTLFATHETPVHLCFLTTTGLSPRLESTVKNCIENTPFLSLGQPLTQNRQICQPTSLLLLSRTAYVTLTQTPTLFNSLPSLLVFHLPK